MSAVTNGQLLEHARLRRAVLEALRARGRESTLLELHDELRTRGVDVQNMRPVHEAALSLVHSECITSRIEDVRGRPRRFYMITDEGRAELARPGRP